MVVRDVPDDDERREDLHEGVEPERDECEGRGRNAEADRDDDLHEVPGDRRVLQAPAAGEERVVARDFDAHHSDRSRTMVATLIRLRPRQVLHWATSDAAKTARQTSTIVETCMRSCHRYPRFS